MSIGAELEQYILQTQFNKKFCRFNGGFERPLWIRWWAYVKLRARVDSWLKLTQVRQLITCDKLTI